MMPGKSNINIHLNALYDYKWVQANLLFGVKKVSLTTKKRKTNRWRITFKKFARK